MNKAKNWILENKITTLLILIVVFFVAKESMFSMVGTSVSDVSYESADFGSAMGVAPTLNSNFGRGSNPNIGKYDATPQLEADNRMTVTSTRFSILVLDVRETINEIQSQAQTLDGYVTNSNVQTPTEGGKGSVTLRVPLSNREQMLTFLREVGVKVVSENVDSTDVTDEYMDINGRLATLAQTKARYEEILASATDVAEILKVQQHIFQVQDEIDRLIGRQNYLEATSQSTLITVHLSTDELALPYAPENVWRPEVVFKLAVRSLLGTLQGIGSALIWLGVFSVIWVPLVVAYIVIKRYRNRTSIRA